VVFIAQLTPAVELGSAAGSQLISVGEFVIMESIALAHIINWGSRV
jgi:hypothetical protein